MNVNEIKKSSVINQKVLNGLKILMSGRTLLFNGYPTGLCETFNDSFQLYHIADKEGNVVGFPAEFDTIYKWLNELPDEEITIALAEITLNEINKR